MRAPETLKARRRRLRAGNAGRLASVVMAVSGLIVGAALAYSIGRGTGSTAIYDYAGALDLSGAPSARRPAFEDRAAVVDRVLSSGAPERFDPPIMAADEPRLILIFDDIGPDRAAYEEIMRLPGPLTLSFLPYAPDLQPLVDRARGAGHAVMLHLPMEPAGKADPGPRSLKASMSGQTLLEELDWNLAQFDGYVGVNNHMGSRFTRNDVAMKTVLSVLAERDLFFLDSLTTGKSVAAKAGRAVGAQVYARDVFLDAEAGREAVRSQLALAERIAVETGYAVAILHPRRSSLDVVGPWLATAPARGFRLETVEALPALDANWRARRLIAAEGPGERRQ